MKTSKNEWHFIWEECSKGCEGLGKIAVHDEEGEDCNAWSKIKECREQGNTCSCGAPMKYTIEKA